MTETLARTTQVETNGIDSLADAIDKETPAFTARELVLESYASTQMAYRTKDGTLQIADGSAEAIMMCVFLQDEDMSATYLEGHFRTAAELAAAQQNEQDEDRPDEKDVVTNDAAEADDSISDDTKAETSDVSISSEQANITSDNANTTIEQTNNPKKSIEPVVSTVNSSQNTAVLKAPMSTTITRLIIATQPSKPQLTPVEIETIHTVPEIVSELNDENARSDENLEILITPAAAIEAEPEAGDIAPELTAQHNEPDAESPTVDLATTNELIKTEAITDNHEQIELRASINNVAEETNTTVQQTPPPLELHEQASLEDDEIIAHVDELYTGEPSSGSDKADLELFDTTDEIISAIEEDTVSPTNENIEFVVSPIEESLPTTHEISDTKNKLYECVKAQIAQLPAEMLESLEHEDYTVPKHIESALIDLLEAYEAEDPELQLRIYIEQYGVSGIFDAIIEGTFVAKTGLRTNHTESDSSLTKHLKLARFATHALTLPREQSFFHGSPSIRAAA